VCAPAAPPRKDYKNPSAYNAAHHQHRGVEEAQLADQPYVTNPSADPRWIPAVVLVRQTGPLRRHDAGDGRHCRRWIFINPYVVARQVHTPALILGAWIFGGIIGWAGPSSGGTGGDFA